MKLSKKIIEKLADFIDNMIHLNGLLETFDGLAIKTVLQLLNNKFGDQIPDNVTPMIESFLEAAVIQDWELATQRLSELLALLINTPFVDGTPEEVQTFNTFLTIIAEQVKKWIESTKGAQ